MKCPFYINKIIGKQGIILSIQPKTILTLQTMNKSISNSRDCTHLFCGHEALRQECEELGVSFSRIEDQFEEERIMRQQSQYEKDLQDEQYELAMIDSAQPSPNMLAAFKEAERLAVLEEVWRVEYDALEE